MFRPLKLTDKEFDSLEIQTRRSILRQVMIVDTPKFKYALGALGNYWTMARYDRAECIGTDDWKEDYDPELVDKWV